MPVTFRHNSARVSVSHRADGLVELAFSGPISLAAMRELGVMSAQATMGARALVFLLDQAVLLFDDMEGLHRPTTATHQGIPGVLLVSEDQIDMADRYSRASAARGIIRAVFLRTDFARALRWISLEAFDQRCG